MTPLGRVFLNLALLFMAAPLFAASDANPSAPPPATVNWPMYKGRASRTGFNPAETTINVGNAQMLTQSWVGIMGDLVDVSSPAVVNGVVYVGSFDGKLYAFDANGCGQAACQPLWSGATQNSITSSPAVAQGTVFIGSNDHKFYAFP